MWTLKDKTVNNIKAGKSFSLNDLSYKVMICQPDFVIETLALETIKIISAKKPNKHHERVQFEELNDGSCLQMLHKGPFSTEEDTFAIMDEYCKENQLQRNSPYYKENYLSNPRKSAPENDEIVLRYQVKGNFSLGRTYQNKERRK